jgi:hypothetical protein
MIVQRCLDFVGAAFERFQPFGAGDLLGHTDDFCRGAALFRRRYFGPAFGVLILLNHFVADNLATYLYCHLSLPGHYPARSPSSGSRAYFPAFYQFAEQYRRNFPVGGESLALPINPAYPYQPG